MLRRAMTDASRANQGEPTNPLDRLANKLQDVDTADAELAEVELKPFVGDESKVPIGLKRLGDFDLIQRLGKGGQGAVYLARQRSLGNRLVAVKVIRLDEAFDTARIARFRGEALAASKVQHSGIVSVHFVGEQHGVHYIAQELIEGGRTLADLIKERRNAQPQDHHRSMAELFAKIAEALEAVHQAKVIHRDIKPSNILLTPQGEPKVADFGLAKDLDGVNLLTSGETPGTLAYKSPEHLDKRIGTVDARSDVFSLGVSFYEALTFMRPFDGNEVEVAARILHHEVGDLRVTCPAVPADLSVICRKAIEKLPARRYASMSEFAADLRLHLTNQPICAKPTARADRVVKWARRRPTLIGILGVLVLYVFTLIGWYAWLVFGVSSKISSERASLQSEIESLQPQIDYCEALQDEQKALAEIRDAAFAMVSEPISWTRKLDELFAVVGSGGGDKQHSVWLAELQASQESDEGAASAGSLTAIVRTSARDFEHIANFLEDLERSPFMRDFRPLRVPDASNCTVDTGVWSVPLRLTFKSSAELQTETNR
jgi:serine/threonine protein kinase